MAACLLRAAAPARKRTATAIATAGAAASNPAASTRITREERSSRLSRDHAGRPRRHMTIRDWRYPEVGKPVRWRAQPGTRATASDAGPHLVPHQPPQYRRRVTGPPGPPRRCDMGAALLE